MTDTAITDALWLLYRTANRVIERGEAAGPKYGDPDDRWDYVVIDGQLFAELAGELADEMAQDGDADYD